MDVDLAGGGMHVWSVNVLPLKRAVVAKDCFQKSV